MSPNKKSPKPKTKALSVEKLREKPRALVAQPAVGWIVLANKKHWIRILDISQTGMRILDLDNKPLIASVLKIWWRLMSGLPEVELRGEVVWSNKGTCGLRFVDLGAKESRVLNQFVKFHRSEIEADTPLSSK